MGVVVLSKHSDTFDIIDGQQRLATITILFSCIRNLCKLYMDNKKNDCFIEVDKKLIANTDVKLADSEDIVIDRKTKKLFYF